jgi:CheY-like chemotaxis protein
MKKILLIEDNLEVRENTAEILELANYEVTTAENGKIGVDMAIQNKPDLIICDIMMPQLDGYGVLHVLSRNKNTAGIPFIFLTAKTEKMDFRKGMNMGADDYLTKPFDEVELLDAIESRLRKREISNGEYAQTIDGVNEFITDARAIGTCSARSADSRPEPGPRTSTSRVFMPCSCAFLAASSAATCAANGVDLRDPLNPTLPDDAQAMTLPCVSAIVTIVLLNDDLMCAMPCVMFLRSRRFGRRPPGGGFAIRLARSLR